MKRIAQEFDEKKLTVIWIGFQDRPDKIKAYSERLGVRPVGYDRNNVVSRKYGIAYGAGVIFIDSTGMARKRLAKGFTESALREALQNIL